MFIAEVRFLFRNRGVFRMESTSVMKLFVKIDNG